MKKTILITGATDGMGKIMATELAQKGHHIIIHGRKKEKAEKVKVEIQQKTSNQNIDIVLADLFSLKAIKSMTDEIKEKYAVLDVIINNAGAIMDKERNVTSDGLEKTMMLNVYAPFLINFELIDLIKTVYKDVLLTRLLLHIALQKILISTIYNLRRSILQQMHMQPLNYSQSG